MCHTADSKSVMRYTESFFNTTLLTPFESPLKIIKGAPLVRLKVTSFCERPVSMIEWKSARGFPITMFVVVNPVRAYASFGIVSPSTICRVFILSSENISIRLSSRYPVHLFPLRVIVSPGVCAIPLKRVTTGVGGITKSISFSSCATVTNAIEPVCAISSSRMTGVPSDTVSSTFCFTTCPVCLKFALSFVAKLAGDAP